ncbi:cell envelope integrity protein CreD [Stappia indica]|uniref:cell envelope integrity protein CreD n=1 Tax=Stappia indica TaxID=538381 RepID=UPI001CD781A5|nr:cell envelope integrity protein CreD [Stappia indica]MCA1299907.1 cell envelope integrity protein CreD [Stappia indica]
MTQASAGASGRLLLSTRPRVSTPGTKFVLIGFVTLLLFIPSLMIWALVEERESRARGVADEIARGWGDAQMVNGPYLLVPYLTTREVRSGGETFRQTDRNYRLFYPKTLTNKVEATVEERKKSIYTLPVFQGRIDLSGRFEPADMAAFEQDADITVLADQATLVIGISDMRAVKNDVSLHLDGSSARPFQPGLGALDDPVPTATGRRPAPGIHVPISEAEWRSGFAFRVDLALNGSQSLHFTPAGQSTNLQISSPWPHPGFTGAFLPDARSISKDGFTASWSIPFLARGVAKAETMTRLPLTDQPLGVRFVQPVDLYQMVARCLKYGIGFIALTFLAVFILELKASWSMYWIQYLLVGFALMIFYLLLLAFAEQIGYDWAYLVAATAITLLVAAYVSANGRDRRAGAVMAIVLATIYGVLYLLMREQDYALLVGSVIAFLAIAVTMFATRNVEWSGTAGQALEESAKEA